MSIDRERTQQAVRTIHPAADHDACGAARVEFVESLDEAGVIEHDASVAVLALGEMLSNAVRHGRPRPDGTVELSWTLADDRLRVAVRDGGCAEEIEDLAARRPPVEAQSGRGLWMVEKFARDWGVDTEDGTEVWAVFSATRRH